MLNIKNLNLSYEGKNILEDINLEIKEGEVFVLTGFSGTGKSSIIKILNGIIPEMSGGKISGEIILNGESIHDKNISQRSKYVSTVFQNPKTQFYCLESTDEIAFPLENRNIDREVIFEKIDTYTKLLNTEKLMDKNIFSLSGGEKQLVAITSVVAMDNKIYLFDEPSASLDHESIGLLKKAILKLKKMGKIVIIAEHRLYYLMDILDTLAIISDKKISTFSKKDLKKDDFKEKIKKEYILRSFKEISKNKLISSNYKKINLLQNDNLIEKNNVLKCLDFQVKFDKEKIINTSVGFEDGINFIIGENGVGKSTFIKRLSNIYKGKGKTFYKESYVKKSYDYISMVMQDVNYQIFTESVWSEISIVSDDKDKKEKILKELDLYDKKDFHPQILSGGEKQRLMIALAKASKKPIVILDEPTSGLCKKQLLSMVNYLKEMKDEGKIVIVITHDYEFISLCGGNIYEFVR